MDLLDWLDMPVSDDDRARPEETLWLDFAALELRSDKLAVADPASFHESAVLVVLRPWRYEVQAKLLPVGGERRISRARAVRGAAGGARGKLLGRVASTGRVGFADYELVGAVVDERGDLEGAGSGPASVATLDEARDAVMPLLTPGAEGESFPVYELVSGDKRVGAEVVFIEV
jgi:hypothetical protein